MNIIKEFDTLDMLSKYLLVNRLGKKLTGVPPFNLDGLKIKNVTFNDLCGNKNKLTQKIVKEFESMDKLTQYILVNRFAVMIDKDAPYNLNKGFEKEIKAVYDKLNEKNLEHHFTLENCVVNNDGEIVILDNNKRTGCFITNRI